MTTPNQPLPPSVTKILGIGAFTVDDGGTTKYGQGVTEDTVNGLVNIPTPGGGNMLQVLGQALTKLPLDTLQKFRDFVPSWLDGDDDDVTDSSGASGKIIGSLIPIDIPQTISDFTSWVADKFSPLSTAFDQIGSILTGDNVTPISNTVQNVKDWFGSLGDRFTDTDDKFSGLFDGLWSGLRQTSGTNKSAADVGNAAADTSIQADTAQQIGEWNNAVLGIRNNKSLMSGVDETEESNFSIETLFSGEDDPSGIVSATAAAVPVAYWRASEDAKKGFISWFGKGFANITALYIDIYKANFDTNTWDLIHTSPDQFGTLSDTWNYSIYYLDEDDRFQVVASDVIGVAWRVEGTGTHEIAGKHTGGWLPVHPTVTPGKPASTRTGSGALAFGSTTYANDIPWFGIGIVTGDIPPPFYAPRTQTFSDPGTFTFTIPTEFQVAGVTIDRVACGAGNGGHGSAAYFPAAGGLAGTWAGDTLTYGTDVPLGTTALTIVVGDGGDGGAGSLAGAGEPGEASSVSGTGITTLSAAGGNGQNVGGAGIGLGPGDFELNGKKYQGGGFVSYNSNGNSPGGGGGGGFSFSPGRKGGAGMVAITVRQP